jgi:predicted DNA-binding protein (UPF0251 family)
LFSGRLEANRFVVYQRPDRGLCARGKGIVLALRWSRFVPALAPFGTFAHKVISGEVPPIVRPIIQPRSEPVRISIMTEPLQLKDSQQNLLAEQQNIPTGVMQAVLMHALQLRRGCREVFLLCDIQRHSVTEAALILGISRAAANRRLQIARRRMDEAIGHLCGAPQEDARLKSK